MTAATRTGARAKATKAPARPAKPKAPTQATKRPRGGQTIYTPAIAATIIAGLTRRIPLTVICSEPGMPCDDTVRNWAEKDEAFGRAIARARDTGFDLIALDAMRIADTPVDGKRIKRSEDGTEVVVEDMLGHRKLQVETRLKLLAKWDPKRYGDKTTTELTGAGGGAIQHSIGLRFVDGEADAALTPVFTEPSSQTAKAE